MSNQRTGKVYIRHGGKLLNSMPGATLRNPMGNQRNPVVGNQPYGFTEEALVPEVECQISHGADVSLKELYGIVDATCTFECDSGAVFILSNAWTAQVTDLQSQQGQFKLLIHARQCTEQGSAL